MQTPCAKGPTRHHTHPPLSTALQPAPCRAATNPDSDVDEKWGCGMAGQAEETESYWRKWEPIAEFQPHITSDPAVLPWWCQKSSAPLEKQPLTFVERRFSGLVGDVRLSPSLQQGEQTVQVAPAGGQVESRLLIEGALVDCAGVRCEETARPKSLWHVVHEYLQHHHLSKSWEF